MYPFSPQYFPVHLPQCPQSELDLDLVRTILGESKIHNADITLKEDVTAEDLIDVVEGNRVYIPAIYVLNKIDQISIEVCVYFIMSLGNAATVLLCFAQHV